MYIVLLGPPGSGKGTQGGKLSKRMGISHLSTGDLFRDILADPNHELYEKIKVINGGKLVSDEIVNKVVGNGLKNPEYRSGVIFDGYPRTVAQAQVLDEMLGSIGKKLKVVIDIHVTQEVLFDRLLGRRSCPQCKRIFHISQGFEECPDCKVALIKRDDDNEKTIMERFEEYRLNTEPLQKYYQEGTPKYIEVTVTDVDTTSDEVQREIWNQMMDFELV